MSEEKNESLKEKHLQFAKSTNNRVWELLEKNRRSPAEDQEMILSAFASLYHWMNAGTAVNTQRAYWMLSSVYQVLNKSEDALDWALKCQVITERYTHKIEDFDLAFAQEGLARAYALSGDHKRAKRHYDQAVSFGELIQDPEDKLTFENDLQDGNWFKLSPE